MTQKGRIIVQKAKTSEEVKLLLRQVSRQNYELNKGREVVKLRDEAAQLKKDIAALRRKEQKVTKDAEEKRLAIRAAARQEAAVIIAKGKQDAVDIVDGTKKLSKQIENRWDELRAAEEQHYDRVGALQGTSVECQELLDKIHKKEALLDKREITLREERKQIKADVKTIEKLKESIVAKEGSFSGILADLRSRESEIAKREQDAEQVMLRAGSAAQSASQKSKEADDKYRRAELKLLEARQQVSSIETQTKQLAERTTKITLNEKRLRNWEDELELKRSQIRAKQLT
jgi:hypothetical protein